MPALPVIANIFRCALNWSDAGGQNAVNVIHISGPSSGTLESEVMEALDDAVGTNQWDSVANTAVVTDVAITKLDGVTATQHFAPAVAAAWTGQRAGDFSPATSALIKLTTSLRGRSHRGRIYLPFTAESVISNGSLNGAQVANLTTGWSDFIGHLQADADGPFNLVIASYKLATAHGVDHINAEAMVATQRRRQGRLRGA